MFVLNFFWLKLNKLLIFSLQEVDMGWYTCSVSAWSLNNQGNFVKISEQQSPPLNVKWAPKRKGPYLASKLMRVEQQKVDLCFVRVNKSL